MNSPDGLIFKMDDITVAVDLAYRGDFTGVAAMRHNADGTMTLIDCASFYGCGPALIDGECRRVE